MASDKITCKACKEEFTGTGNTLPSAAYAAHEAYQDHLPDCPGIVAIQANDELVESRQAKKKKKKKKKK